MTRFNDKQTRIRKILSDGEWHTTRAIAEIIYSDFTDADRRKVYISRTNVTLHRMLNKGIVDVSKGGRESSWKLKEVAA